MEIIAYYLPQYHSIPENDMWWGKGFTEWTNVAKAKPLFKGHKQPHVPADLGFYNLLNVNDQRAQIELAKESGITAFCYWHYWFGNGKLLLEKPIKNVLSDMSLDFPFCFGWANESWQAKVWSSSGNTSGKTLIKQEYPGDDDINQHFRYLKPYLEDRRYFRINDRPVFVIYRPNQLPNKQDFVCKFNKLIKESRIAESFHFIAHTINDSEIDDLLLSFDSVNVVRFGCYRFDNRLIRKIPLELIKYKLFGKPLAISYKKIVPHLTLEIDKHERVIPTIIPNWDHTPRSGNKGSVYTHVTPELFHKHVQNVFDSIKDKKTQIVFLKSWNEWGEGNYLEPDIENGHIYIDVLKHAVVNFQTQK